MSKTSLCSIAIIGTFALALSSCYTVDPYTGEQKVAKATAGAGIGAASGAILGAVIGNNTGSGDAGRGAAIGAAAGALIGGGIGNYMDQQEAAIRQQLEGTGVSVTRVGNDIVLNMPHDVTFDVGRDQIRGEFAGTLDSVALVLNKFNRTLVNIDGHTDSTGGASYNQGLSERRAGAVAQYFTSRRVDPRRLIVRGFGESKPIASNATESGRAANRRVEIRIVPQR